jgi:hypothetical protein
MSTWNMDGGGCAVQSSTLPGLLVIADELTRMASSGLHNCYDYLIQYHILTSLPLQLQLVLLDGKSYPLLRAQRAIIA